MKPFGLLSAVAMSLLLPGGACFGEIKVVVEHNDNDHASPAFQFKNIRPPFGATASAGARFTVLSGTPSPIRGGDLGKLHDGGVPSEQDQPEENFFFAHGTAGGRILVDLGHPVAIQQVNTYSWHPNTRGPQVYALYARDPGLGEFDPKLEQAGSEPAKAGWKLVAKVDTRSLAGPMGGQYGVSISDPAGVIGTNRYLLFEISATEDSDPFGNTFYSEIAVIDRDAPSAVQPGPPPDARQSFEMEGPKYHFTFDTIRAPKLKDWANGTLAPVVREWYPKLVELLPSDGFVAPLQFSIVFNTNYQFQGIASTAGTRITGDANWYAGELHRGAVGSMVHELAHVAQQYEYAGMFNPNAVKPPGWLVEGIADYLRFYVFEPQSGGAEITSRRGAERARYDGSYRVTANFLNFVVEKYDRKIVQELNAALREGRETQGLWKQRAGRSLEELGTEWKDGLLAKAGAEPPVPVALAPATAHGFTNSLGLRFAPVPGTKVLFSVWITRVRDFERFIHESGYDAGPYWKNPGFAQTPDDPVCNVGYEHANAFCDWLTRRELASGLLRPGQSYRLPNDAEWSVAVGLTNETGDTPSAKNQKIKDVYPWGTQWPPPLWVGNYAPVLKVDDYEQTSPVGSFTANKYGLYDMGGNVWQWCDDWFDQDRKYRVLRGAAWASSGADRLLSSCRFTMEPNRLGNFHGFRVVLAGVSPAPKPAAAESEPPAASKPSAGKHRSE